MAVTNEPSFLHLTRAKKITFLILFLLLGWRVILSYLLQWRWNGEEPRSVESSYIWIVYWLISVVIWLNRGDLRSLNIDKNFFTLFIFIGGLYSGVFFLLSPFASGVFLGLATLINLVLYLYGSLPFEDIRLNYRQTMFYSVILMMPAFIINLILGLTKTWPNETTIFMAVFNANLPIIIFEEAIYRGMLWMFLTNLNIKNHYIFVAQVLLFWFSHINYLFQPVAFWFYMPFLSIILGLMVWRSKTITSSIIGHFVYNWFGALLRSLI